MKIRLIGPAEECGAVLEALRALAGLSVIRASAPYQCHDDEAAVRVYVDASVEEPHGRGRPATVKAVRPDPDHVGIARAMRSYRR